MVIFIVLNLIVCISAYLLLNRIFKLADVFDSIIGIFIAYLAQIILTELVLGICGILTLQNLIFLNLAVLLSIYYFARRKLSVISFVEEKASWRTVFQNKDILFISALLLGFILVKVFVNLINPPFGWDDLNYHFTFPVEWLKHANLVNPIVASDDPFPTYYPINGSLFFLWLIIPFKSAFLADVAQLPFFIVSFLAIIGIGRKLKLPDVYSYLAACLFVFIPNLFKQLQIGYVDIMVGGLFLVALNFLLSLRNKFALSNIVFFAASIGILIGIKTTAVLYCLFLLLPFVYLFLINRDIGIREKTVLLTVSALIIFLFGGFSYLRNIVLTGNPLYPLSLTVIGREVFKGVIDKATFIARSLTEDYGLGKLLFHEGLGVQALLVVLPGAVLAPFVAIFKDKDKDLFFKYILVLPLLLYFAYRYLLPLPNSRYLYPMLGAGMIIGFYVFYALKLPQKVIRVGAVILAIASAAECARKLELGLSFALSIMLFVLLVFIQKNKRLRETVFSRISIGIVIVAGIIGLQLCFIDYKNNEYSRYIKNSRYWPDATKAWAWLNKNTSRDNIAYVGRPVPFPLYGTDLKNNVYYVSVNAIDPIHLHDLKDSRYRWVDAETMHKNFEEPNNYRGNTDYSVWLFNLKRRGADYLFVYSLHHVEKNVQFPLEDAWAKAHAQTFKPVFSNETVHIYRIYL